MNAEIKLQKYEVHYRCAPSDVSKANALLRRLGMEEVVGTPTDWKGNIRGIIRATDVNDAELRSREIISKSEGTLSPGHHIKNLSQEEHKAKKPVSAYIREIFSF